MSTNVTETGPAGLHAAGHGHGHGHDPDLAHHFEDMGQQRSSATLGMWTFLGTEVMFFGGLIGSYLVYRFTTPDVWAAASRQLNVTIGTVNTVVLLTSSLMVALAVHAGETGDQKKQVRFLILTGVLGALFMVFKAYEYYEEYEKHLLPGPHFSTAALKLPEEPPPPNASREVLHEAERTMQTASVLSVTPSQFVARRAQMFFVFYFTMTGLHLLHMVIGLGLVTWVTLLARQGRFTAHYHVPLETVGLYWHFVDIVWVFLYPLLYLVALHK
jgi:cytochrome c oxidase subunit 3